jgi:hypothetical protein
MRSSVPHIDSLSWTGKLAVMSDFAIWVHARLGKRCQTAEKMLIVASFARVGCLPDSVAG